MNVNVEQMKTVKEYAETTGVSIQAIHQQIKRQKNKSKLEGHIHVVNGIKYLDEVAIEVLDSSREKTPVAEWNAEKDKKIRDLEADIERNRKYIVALEIANTNYLERNTLLEGRVKQLEADTQNREEEKKVAIKEAEDQVKLQYQESENKLRNHYQEEIDKLKEELQEEKTRKLSVAERIFGYKKR